MIYFTALIDFIPNILFLGSACLLLVRFFKELNLPNFVFLATGSLLVFLSGFLKAWYKTLLYFSICRIEIFNSVFLLIQSIGFILMAAGLIGLVVSGNKNDYNIEKSRKFILKLVIILCSIIVVCGIISLGLSTFIKSEDISNIAELNIKMPLITITVIGLTISYSVLGVYAIKNKQILTFVLLIIAIVCAFAMGYLGTKNFDFIYLNIVAEFVNIIGQLCFFIACYRLTSIKN